MQNIMTKYWQGSGQNRNLISIRRIFLIKSWLHSIWSFPKEIKYRTVILTTANFHGLILKEIKLAHSTETATLMSHAALFTYPITSA